MDVETVRTMIKGNALFQDLDPKDLEALAVGAGERHFSPGDVIYRKGEISLGKMALIVAGKVQVVTEDGHVVRDLGPGELIGEVGSVSREGKRTVTLNVVQPARLIEWGMDALEGVSSVFMKRLKDLAWNRLRYYNE